MDKRTFIGIVEAGEPLIQQAIDAIREYHQARIVARRLKRSSVYAYLRIRYTKRLSITS